MIVDEMKYKQLHMVWHVNFDTESHCKFKTYLLENNFKTRVKNWMFNYCPQNYTLQRL